MTSEHKKIYFPPSLQKGDKIAVLSPASAVMEEYVERAMSRIRDRGFEPVLMKHAIRHSRGSYSSSVDERLQDLTCALAEPDIKAILCARGGYGCVHLLPAIDLVRLSESPKWIIGFSDVSALLALWYTAGIASIHGPMAKHLATMPEDDRSGNSLFNMLENGGMFDYMLPGNGYNRQGRAAGILRGGNFAVLNGLAATPYDILDIRGKENVILFFEDISEQIYAIERMLWRLCLSGALSKVKGLIFGQFTEYHPDRNFRTMEEMIHYWIERRMIPGDIPVVFDFPVGHVDNNYPLTVGATVELDVTAESVSLRTV